MAGRGGAVCRASLPRVRGEIHRFISAALLALLAAALMVHLLEAIIATACLVGPSARLGAARHGTGTLMHYETKVAALSGEQGRGAGRVGMLLVGQYRVAPPSLPGNVALLEAVVCRTPGRTHGKPRHRQRG